jgi:dCMP deaminase
MEQRERPSWDECFMFHAWWTAARSSCQKLQTGADIVKDKRIIASGYNGAPPGIENCLERGCRKESFGIDFHTKGKGVCRGSHAEENAMDQIAREYLKGTTIYTVVFPCSPCAKKIVGNGIVEVVYCVDYKEDHSYAYEAFAEAKVKVRQMDIDFDKCFRMMSQIYGQLRK